jgi:hypothetical protein
MSFGRNPHVAKAEAAEQKARCARDRGACELAWREAARQWDRAADREADDKRKREFADKADAARACAEDPRVEADGGVREGEAERVEQRIAPPKGGRLLN